MKLFSKFLLAQMLSLIGAIRLPRPARDWFTRKLCPLLLDPRVLPHQLVPRKIRSLDVTILCNPYIFPHRAPYWFGELHASAIEKYLRRTLSPGDTVIDVGCNVGHITIMAAALVGHHGHVYAFDPQKAMAKLTSDHCHQQGLTQVRVFPYGLGTRKGQFPLHVNPNQPGRSTLRNIDRAQTNAATAFTQIETVQIDIADDVLHDLAFTGTTLLKIDVEGHEKEVLQGLANTLINHVDHVVIEISPQWIGGATGVSQLIAILTPLGFRHYHLLSDGTLGGSIEPENTSSQIDAVFVKTDRAEFHDPE